MSRRGSPRGSGIVVAVALGVTLFAVAGAHAQTDPLASWNEGPAKQAILAFVKATTEQASPTFVPP